MSQREFLADLDACLHEAFADMGMADTGTYTAPTPGAVAVPCRVYVDKGMQQVGDYAPAYAAEVLLALLRADVPTPLVGGVVLVDGDAFELEAVLDADDGVTRWRVGRAHV